MRLWSLQLQLLQCQWKKKDPAPDGVHSGNETTQSFTSTPGLYQVRQATAPWEGDCKDQRKRRKGSSLNSVQGPASHPVGADPQSCVQLRCGPTPLSSSEGKEWPCPCWKQYHTPSTWRAHSPFLQQATWTVYSWQMGPALAEEDLEALPAREASSGAKK